MKISLATAANLLIWAKERANQKGITLCQLFEASLGKTLVRSHPGKRVVPVTFKGKGLTPEFEGASWVEIRDAISR